MVEKNAMMTIPVAEMVVVVHVRMKDHLVLK
jgi:hypothetical protein